MRVTKRNINIKQVFIASASFALGGMSVALVGFWPLFEIEWKIDVGQILGAFFGLGLAVFFAWFIDRRGADKRVEKDILIERVSGIEARIASLNELFISGEIPYLLMISKVRGIRAGIWNLSCCLESNGYSLPEVKDDAFQHFTKIYKGLTGFGNVYGRVADNKFKVDSGQWPLLEQLLLKTEDDLNSLKISINRLN